MPQSQTNQSQSKPARRWLFAARTFFALSVALAMAALYVFTRLLSGVLLSGVRVWPVLFLVGFYSVILFAALRRKLSLELGFSYAVASVLLLGAALASANLTAVWVLWAYNASIWRYSLPALIACLLLSFPVHLTWIVCSFMAARRTEPRTPTLKMTIVSFAAIGLALYALRFL